MLINVNRMYNGHCMLDRAEVIAKERMIDGSELRWIEICIHDELRGK